MTPIPMGATAQQLVQDSLLATAATSPEKPAIVDETERLMYGELSERALRFARALQDGGLRPGERVVLYLDNTAACATAIFGTLLAGGVFVVVNPQTKAEKLAYVLGDSEAAALVVAGRLEAIAAEALQQAPSVRLVLETGGAGGSPTACASETRSSAWLDLDDAIRAAEPEPADPGTSPSDLASLIYTSGTTGLPKGVMMTHGALVFSVGSIAEYLRLDSEDRILNILPFAFTYGLNQLLLSVRLGATLVLEPSFVFPPRTLERIRNEAVTVFPGVPTTWATLIGMEGVGEYPSVRCLTNAAAGLPPPFHDGLRRLFPNAAIFRMYGLTECIRVCYLEPDLLDVKPTSVGKAIPGTEAFVLNEAGERAEPGEIGVLHVRGPHLMLGYWRAPEATAHMLRAEPGSQEKTLCTHDHFTVDEDGDLTFVDRSDDIIKTRGEKVSSVEVENALHEIPGVRTVAVVGFPDELLGQAIRAYVVLEEGAALTEREIVRLSRSRLEGFMVPQEVRLVAELPETESGKIRKKSLLADD
ncbi:MAG: class I adenylate-forming enzyme family protein [Gaiellaceae bacterium]